MNKNELNIFLIIIVFFIFSKEANSQIYVSTTGSDTNNGTIEMPYETIVKAISSALPGDTIFVRSGLYNLSSTITISSSKSGTEEKMYYLFGYQDERPLLDFSALAVGVKGIRLNANYWYIKGFDVTKAGHNGLGITGSYNIIEHCTFFENRNTGLQLDNGASYNKIINCDSYYNYDDHNEGADADGFAPKLTVGTGNYFYGCRAWVNSDDGWDGYLRGANDVTTTLENCWTWGNGYAKDGYDPGSRANGNGFKMGGGDNSNSLQLMHHTILINCLAFNNKSKGFDQNNNVGSMTIINGTGFGNKTANYRITRQLNSGQTLVVKNSLSFNGKVELGSFAVQERNSWHSQFSVSENDFLSINPSDVAKPRKPDGSLPDIQFMNLAPGSLLIDAGVDLGYPYNGSAPDLGAFESDYTTHVGNKKNLPEEYELYQNYPNPFNPETTIGYLIPHMSKNGSAFHQHVLLKVYDILGKEKMILVNEMKQPGKHEVKFDAGNLASGIYFYKIFIYAGNSGEIFSQTKKLILIK